MESGGMGGAGFEMEGPKGPDTSREGSDRTVIPTIPKILTDPGAGAAVAPSAPAGSAIADLAAKFGYGATGGGGLGSLNIPGLPTGFVSPAGAGPGTPPVGGLTEDPWTAYNQEVSADVPYLRSPLEQTTEGQAQLAMANHQIDVQADQEVERLNNEWGGRAGAGADSGVLKELRDRIEQRRQQSKSDVAREWAAQTTGRLGQSRDITAALMNAEQGRMMTAAGLEQTLYDQERQRLADELAAASGQTLAPAAGTAGTLLEAGIQQQQLANQANAALGKGLGSLGSMFFNQQPTATPPAPAPSPVVNTQDTFTLNPDAPGTDWWNQQSATGGSAI